MTHRQASKPYHKETGTNHAVPIKSAKQKINTLLRTEKFHSYIKNSSMYGTYETQEKTQLFP